MWTRVEPDDVEPPERLGGPPGPAPAASASWAADDSRTCPGWAMATSRAARASGGPTGSSSRISRSPTSMAIRVPSLTIERALHGTDRIAEDDVTGSALWAQLGPALRWRRPPRWSSSGDRARCLALPRIAPAGIVEIGDEHRPALHGRPDAEQQVTVLGEDSRSSPAARVRDRSPGPRRAAARAGVGTQAPPPAARTGTGRACERPQALTVRVLDRQRVELGDHLTMPSRPHVGVDARLQRSQPHLAQAGDLTVEVSIGFDVGVGMAPPQRQRLAQAVGGPSGIVDGGATPTAVLEHDGVDRRLGAVEEVGVALADDDVAEHLPQVRDVRVQRRPSHPGWRPRRTLRRAMRRPKRDGRRRR